MKGRSTIQRLRRSWRVARREVTGAARALPDMARLERPGHARGRRPVDWDLSERPYRRAVTPLAFAVLFLGAIIGSYWAAAGGLFDGHSVPGAKPVAATPAAPPSPSASTPPAVTVLPPGPVPSSPVAPTTRKPAKRPTTQAPTTPPAAVVPVPSVTSSAEPPVTGSPDPATSPSLSPVAIPSPSASLRSPRPALSADLTASPVQSASPDPTSSPHPARRWPPRWPWPTSWPTAPDWPAPGTTP